MGRRSGRPSTEARRAEILDAAGLCFAERGFDATTIDEIAARAGVSKGAIYWHFEGKRALLTALVDHFFDVMLAAYRGLIAGKDSVRESLQALFELTLSNPPDEVPIGPLGLELAAHATRDEELRQYIEHLFRRLREVVLEPIERGIQTGEIQAIDPHRAVATIFAVLDGLMVQKVITPEPDQEATWIAAVELLMRGLETPEAQKST
jgi:AcrR family transcriptional regulator